MDKKLKLAITLTIVLVGLAVIIDMSQEPQLKYPLDQQSKRIIEQTTDEFLEEKVFDLIWKRTFHWLTFFESLDGFTVTEGGAGTNVLTGTDLIMTTGALTTNANEVIKQPAEQGLMTFSRRSNMRAGFLLGQITDQTVYIVVGGLSSGSYYGFKITNATLYGVVSNGSTESTVTLATLSASTVYTMEARYSPKEKVIFYVDAVEKGVIQNSVATPIPLANETASVRLMDIKITTNADAAKVLQISLFEYLQHRNVLR